MAKKPRKALTFVEKMQKFIHAGISGSAVPNRLDGHAEDLSSLDERIKKSFRNCKSSKQTGFQYVVFCDV